ncbi:hypothetical protein HPP92_024151 [Vanilla planifolia]|uniref:Uncharacterized protein n=1 Tax=Vanilla planifolia TaxID=51239 RepID=A0A835PND5_VANPL|nr:hypothetical protein HPP92_024151 [Vanilla planifolia]
MAAEQESNVVNPKQPLLELNTVSPGQKNQAHRAINQAFRSTAQLAKLLPTGTVLAFQLLSPVLTNQGRCISANRTMTACLLGLCTLFCFLHSFTDSFRDGAGNVRHGMATFGGLWVVDGPETLPPDVARNYRLRLVDFVHAFMSVMVFVAVVLIDQNVVSCFYPIPSENVKQVTAALPVAIGAVSSVMFVIFPTTRNGIGFPLSSD